MSARDELVGIIQREYIRAINRKRPQEAYTAPADAILAAGYTKPRTIESAAELEALAFGSAVLTSDEGDTVVLRCEGSNFRNQSGADLSATDLWRYGTHPLTVLWQPTA